MIEISQGNMLEAPVEALVNTVNTKGVMGTGIALQFKQAFPAMFRDYERACKAGEVRLGKMHVYDLGGLTGGRAGSSTFQPKGIGVNRAD
jgi:O-acetyl-ADP-ribose deacetylase (regulator of RNase III)